MDIEEIAELAVRNEIVKYSDTLVAYIDTKEKTPMWDGYIYMYIGKIVNIRLIMNLKEK